VKRIDRVVKRHQLEERLEVKGNDFENYKTPYPWAGIAHLSGGTGLAGDSIGND
jgi:hypothetical protein